MNIVLYLLMDTHQRLYWFITGNGLVLIVTVTVTSLFTTFDVV
jgi:hypothetical protein